MNAFFTSNDSEGEDMFSNMGEEALKAVQTEEGRSAFITKNENCLYLLKRNNRPAGVTTEKFFQKLLE